MVLRKATVLLFICVTVSNCFQFQFDEGDDRVDKMFYDDLLKSRASQEGPVIDIPQLGSVLGGRTYSKNTRRLIHAFYNVPYAEVTPDTRFKKANDPKPWTGVLNGTYFDGNAVCLQPHYVPGLLLGTEDCLKLQIFVPEGFLPSVDKPDTKIPVYIFIHGGAFITGDAKYYGPHKLLERDIIMVTVQYRLGPSGFFCAHTDDAPGNAGLYDQAMALEWVHKYIEYFGGDPKQITIGGESAGAASVSYLLVNPMTRDKISGAIMESGSALANWALDNNPLRTTRMLAEKLKCKIDVPATDPTYYDKVTQCVKKKPIKEVHQKFYKLSVEDRKGGQLGTGGASPVVQTSGNPKMIEKKWMEYFQAGEFAKVPIMNGANRDEGTFLVAYLDKFFVQPNGFSLKDITIYDKLSKGFLKTLGVQEESGFVADTMMNTYISKSAETFDEFLPGVADMAGAILLKSGGYDIVKKVSAAGVPAYQYSFNYYNPNASLWYFVIIPDPGYYHGVTHTDEMLYLYSMPLKYNEEMQRIGDTMVELWANFIIYKDPTPEERDYQSLGLPKWEKYDSENESYLSIDRESSLEKDYEEMYKATSKFLLPQEGSKPVEKLECGNYGDMKRQLVAYQISFGATVVALAVAFAAVAGVMFVRMRRQKLLLL